MLRTLMKKNDMSDPDQTLLDVLRHHAAHQPDKDVYRTIAEHGAEQTLDFASLHSISTSLANSLAQLQPGDRAVLAYRDVLEFIKAFFACLRLGVIAVPAPPPGGRAANERLMAILLVSRPKLLLSEQQCESVLHGLLESESTLQKLPTVCTDVVSISRQTAEARRVHAMQTALLQYTSGNTGAIKGVMITHHNILTNAALIQETMDYSAETRGVSCLPYFHDMGLMGGVIQPLFSGASVTLMAPASVARQPIIWLKTLSDLKAHASGGPGALYDLCVDTISDVEADTLDLSHWRIANVGAEPIRADTIDAFSRKFARSGFSRRAFFSSYGMAETTLFVCGKSGNEVALYTAFDRKALALGHAKEIHEDSMTARPIVSCGRPDIDTQVAIVDEQSRQRLAEGQLGEIWVAGQSVAEEYWGEPVLSERCFRASISDSHEGPYFRTGDKGFIYAGQLYVSGRIADVVTIENRQFDAHDMEQVLAKAHAALMDYGLAVFSVKSNATKALVVAAEIKLGARQGLRPEVVIEKIHTQCMAYFDVDISEVILVKPQHLPRTTSGKIKRYVCRQLYLQNRMQEIRLPVLPAAREIAATAPL